MQEYLVASSELWVVEVPGAPATVFEAPTRAAAEFLRRRLDSLPPTVPVQITAVAEAAQDIAGAVLGHTHAAEEEVTHAVRRTYPGMQRGLVSLLARRVTRILKQRFASS